MEADLYRQECDKVSLGRRLRSRSLLRPLPLLLLLLLLLASPLCCWRHRRRVLLWAGLSGDPLRCTASGGSTPFPLSIISRAAFQKLDAQLLSVCARQAWEEHVKLSGEMSKIQDSTINPDHSDTPGIDESGTGPAANHAALSSAEGQAAHTALPPPSHRRPATRAHVANLRPLHLLRARRAHGAHAQPRSTGSTGSAWRLSRSSSRSQLAMEHYCHET